MPRHVTWEVPTGEASDRLDVALSTKVKWLSRSAAATAIRDGIVTVNGKTENRPAMKLVPGDTIDAVFPDEATDAVVASDIPVKIAYEDEHIVVVDKPEGLSVHPGPGHATDTLVNGLLKLYPEMAGIGSADRPGVVHRLDLDTSGLLIFALTTQAYDRLGEMMRGHEVRRTYTALVSGRISPPQGTVDAPIGRDPANRTRQAIVESGRPARTHYRLIETVKHGSLLEIELETGRMHQIRVHMAAIGFPVLGDPTYGRSQPIPGLNRQFLHASRLRFKHPVTGEEMNIESPLPPDLQQVLNELRDD
jgi:23S rRNA pseudouridine1911/1915/1917 synthase